MSQWVNEEKLQKAGVRPKPPEVIENRVNRINSIQQMRRDIKLMKELYSPNGKVNGKKNGKLKKNKTKEPPKEFNSVYWLDYADARG